MKHKECFSCTWCQHVETTYYRCRKPSKDVKGISDAIKHGHFAYPLRYDPRFKRKLCPNYKEDK